MSKPDGKRNAKLEKVQPMAPEHWPSLPAEWDDLTRVLGVDLEQLAYETKALQRKRKIRSAGDLLRIVLAYAWWDWSLQLVGAWATVLGLGNLSAVAIRQRLRQSHAWLSRLLGSWLSTARQPLAGRQIRLRLIDATVINRPGSTSIDWRVHLSFDVGALRLDEFEITDQHVGESLLRHAAQAGDVLVADRGYAHRAGLGAILAAGAHAVVRMNGHNLPLETAVGERIDLRRWLRQVPKTDQQRTRCVWVTTPSGRFELRLIARRLPPDSAAKARRRAAKASRQKRHTPSATAREMAGWVVLVSNLPSESWSPSQVLAVYRIRWQVEVLIKRCKSLLNLDQLRAQDPEVAQVYLLAKVLGLLLLQDGLRAQTQQLAEWFDDTRRPLSCWRWTAFWLGHLQALVRGPITLQMIQAALPQLARYLCEAPRKRRQQLATVRHWLLQLNASPTAIHAIPFATLA